MSRGPGKVERIVEQTLRDADRSFSVEELSLLAYPGIDRAEKKHRVTVLRTLDNVAKKIPLRRMTTLRPPWRLIVSNLLNVRSYAHARLREEYWSAERSLEQIEHILSDHEVQSELLEPGTRWWIEVEIEKAETEGTRFAQAAIAAGLAETDEHGRFLSMKIADASPEMVKCWAHLHALRQYYFCSLQHEPGPQPWLLGKFEPQDTPAIQVRDEAARSRTQLPRTERQQNLESRSRKQERGVPENRNTIVPESWNTLWNKCSRKQEHIASPTVPENRNRSS